MATKLYIVELERLVPMDSLGKPVAASDMSAIVAVQRLDHGAAAAPSAAFNARTRFIRAFAESKCGLAFGADPTAVDDNTQIPMAAEQVEYFGVAPGQKVSVVTRA